MRTRRSVLPLLLGLAAATLVAGGLALEGSLARARVEARLDARPAHGSAAAEGWPTTAEGHDRAARTARAAGRFDLAARHAVLASRLAPDDPGRQATADAALDQALLAGLRPFARVGMGLGLATLLLLGGLSHRRARRRRAMAAWLGGVEGRLLARVDGRSSAGRAVVVAPGEALTLDLFLTRQGRTVPAPPAPGPTLAVVLSHADSSTSVRLRPRHGIREDAVRTRVRPETLERLFARPGRWRAQARLDGRLVAEAPLEVARRIPVARSA